MEERQIQEFVSRVSRDEVLRKELMSDPERVVAREDFLPEVARVVMQLVPHLSLKEDELPQLAWWRY